MLKHNSKITFLPSPINSICLLHARMISSDQTFQKTRQNYTLCIANYICLILHHEGCKEVNNNNILDENWFHSNLLSVFKWKINMFTNIFFGGYTQKSFIHRVGALVYLKIGVVLHWLLLQANVSQLPKTEIYTI